MINGETVVVEHYEIIRDGFNAEKKALSYTETVSNVIVQPVSTSDQGAEAPNRDSASVRLHFPKAYTSALGGCTVLVRDKRFCVLGEPMRWDAEQTPTDWNCAADCVLYDG